MEQFKAYGIRPHRVSAIDGKLLKPQTINDIGLKYGPNMDTPYEFYFLHFPLDGSAPIRILKGKEAYGKTVFYAKIAKGAIGCFLSHLSVLQDAYNAGFDTIWVIEDDCLIRENPHQLADYIEKLDAQVGKENWDILYTNSLDSGCNSKSEKLNNFAWRPDRGKTDGLMIDLNFSKITNRSGAHSMIIRRSGIKKILKFFISHGLFAPYDNDLFLVPNIQVFNLKKQVVTYYPSTSDIVNVSD